MGQKESSLLAALIARKQYFQAVFILKRDCINFRFSDTDVFHYMHLQLPQGGIQACLGVVRFSAVGWEAWARCTAGSAVPWC